MFGSKNREKKLEEIKTKKDKNRFKVNILFYILLQTHLTYFYFFI